MKCKVCGGAGVIQGQAPGLVSCWPACDGKGFIEQTNEEWLRTLPVDERVKEVLFRGFMTEKRTAEEFVNLLKEKHDE
jgi:hypothetical protein